MRSIFEARLGKTIPVDGTSFWKGLNAPTSISKKVILHAFQFRKKQPKNTIFLVLNISEQKKKKKTRKLQKTPEKTPENQRIQPQEPAASRPRLGHRQQVVGGPKAELMALGVFVKVSEGL